MHIWSSFQTIDTVKIQKRTTFSDRYKKSLPPLYSIQNTIGSDFGLAQI